MAFIYGVGINQNHSRRKDSPDEVLYRPARVKVRQATVVGTCGNIMFLLPDYKRCGPIALQGCNSGMGGRWWTKRAMVRRLKILPGIGNIQSNPAHKKQNKGSKKRIVRPPFDFYNFLREIMFVKRIEGVVWAVKVKLFFLLLTIRLARGN